MSISINLVQMRSFRTLLIALLLCFDYSSYAQIFEPFNFRYRYAPSTEINDSDDPTFENSERNEFYFFELTAKYPVTFKNSDALILPELIFKTSEFGFRNWPEQFQIPRTSNLTRFSIKSVLPVNKKWNILAIGYASQGTNESVSWDLGNTMYRGGLGFLINNRKGNQIGTSILYISEVDLVVPAFIYKGKSENEKWQFNIEAPQLSIVEYSFSEKSRLRLEQRLDNERYFFQNDTFDESFNLTNLNVSVGYSRRLFGPAFLNVSAGFTPLNNITIRNSDDSALETLNLGIQPTISAGIYVSVNPNDYVGK